MAEENLTNLEKLSPDIFKIAWWELYKCLGENLNQEGLDLMDSVLEGVRLDMEE